MNGDIIFPVIYIEKYMFHTLKMSDRYGFGCYLFNNQYVQSFENLKRE